MKSKVPIGISNNNDNEVNIKFCNKKLFFLTLVRSPNLYLLEILTYI